MHAKLYYHVSKFKKKKMVEYKTAEAEASDGAPGLLAARQPLVDRKRVFSSFNTPVWSEKEWKKEEA